MPTRKTIKSVSIVLRPNLTPDSYNILANLQDWLLRRKIKILFLQKEQNRLEKSSKASGKNSIFVDDKEICSKSDLIITMGGDGTLIGAARQCTKNSPPIFGINMGKLGFITEFSKAELFDTLDDIIKGDYEIEKINLFKAEITLARNKKIKSLFLNDAVVSKRNISRVFTLSVEANQEHIYDLSGDGLIVSSPIGSTAYSLSAGGPIISSNVNALVLTPICPHSLVHRPFVISDTSNIEIKIYKNTDPVVLTLDGQEAISLESKATISIKKSNHSIKMIKNSDKRYFNTLMQQFTSARR